MFGERGLGQQWGVWAPGDSPICRESCLPFRRGAAWKLPLFLPAPVPSSERSLPQLLSSEAQLRGVCPGAQGPQAFGGPAGPGPPPGTSRARCPNRLLLGTAAFRLAARALPRSEEVSCFCRRRPPHEGPPLPKLFLWKAGNGNPAHGLAPAHASRCPAPPQSVRPVCSLRPHEDGGGELRGESAGGITPNL